MATAPPLGVAASFAILAGTSVTNTGATNVVGNVGVSPGSSIAGFNPPGVVSGGLLHADDATATQGEADLATAYADLVAEPVNTSLSGQDLGGMTLTPNVYNFATGAQLNGTLTLDAQGNPNAVFVIQIGTALTTGTASSVVLINGAHAGNVFWQVGSSATIGTDTAFQGSILALTSITLDTGADMAPGRALAINGAVTMDANTSSNVFTTPLTITADPQDKIYGAALPALTASYSGFINGDTSASLTTLPTVSTNATAASGVGSYSITASGAVDPYYTFTYVDGSLAVTPASLTITDNQSKVYGAALPTLAASYSGFVNSDTSVNLTTQPMLSTAATSSSHVSGSPYGVSVSGAVDPNYTITYVPGTLTVTTAPLTITADDQVKAYGDALPALTASYSGFVNGDMSGNLTTQPTLSTTATSSSHVSGNPYAITASGAAEPDYAVSYVAGTLTVTAAPLTITADGQDKIYGAPLPNLTASYRGFVNGETSANLTTQPTLSTTATAASGVSGNPYAIAGAGAADPDYTISYVPGTLTVTAAPLTITADDQNKAYGAALPALTASYRGFVNGDTAASLTTQPTLTTTATAASHVLGDPYATIAGGAADPDYVISYAAGTLTVTPVMLTITANDQTKVYGAPVPPLTASYSGLVNGDSEASFATDSNVPPTLTTTATTYSTVAGDPYTISVGGAVDPDYRIAYTAGALNVTSSSTLSGMVYLDLNAGGTSFAGDPGMAGRVVFLDLNHDGTLDPGDPSATTDANGQFTLASDPSGSVLVVEDTSMDSTDRYVVDQTVVNADGSVSIGVVPISAIAPVSVVPDPFLSSPSADANTDYVQSLYHAVLGRTGGDVEVAAWLARMGAGMTQPVVAADFVNSPEHRQDEVDDYYERFLHRAPDPTSSYWVNELLSGVSEEQVAESILDSAEYQSAHQDSTQFIDDLYTDVLGRNGDPLGIASWQATLASGASRETVVSDFVESAEADTQIVDSFYTAFLHRQPEPGGTSDLWVAMLETPNGSVTNVAADILASPEFGQDATTPEA